MTLPTFVGIGAERCGSTWLHYLLNQHPEIYMPVQRKEVNFFSRNYDKGLKWYESFFPNNNGTSYKAIGEISPEYLNYPECAARMASTKSIHKLITILRNPIDRAYSQYGHLTRLRGYSQSFEDFLLDRPDAITYGFYAKNLAPFLEHYERQQLCCLIFENAVSEVASTKKKLAQFLKIEVDKFPESAGVKKVNETYVPKLKMLNYMSSRVRSSLRDSGLDWVVNIIKGLGFQDVLKFGAITKQPPMDRETRLRLQNTFTQDIENLEKLLDLNLDLWRVE